MSSTDEAGVHVQTGLWRGRRFVHELAAPPGTPGWMQQEGFFVRELLSPGDSQGDLFWVCRQCDDQGTEELFSPTVQVDVLNHVAKNHPSIFNFEIASHLSPSAPIPDMTEPRAKRPRVAVDLSGEDDSVDIALGFILEEDQPLDIFEVPALRYLITQTTSDTQSTSAWSSDALLQKLENKFSLHKESVKHELRATMSRIHISHHPWVSPNRRAFLAVFAHFIDRHGKQQQLLLAVRQQSTSQGHMSKVWTIANVIEEWNISDLIGTIVFTGSAIEARSYDWLLRRIKPSLNAVFQRQTGSYETLLNAIGATVLQHVVFGGREEIRRREIRQPQGSLGRSPVGKLHDFVTWVRESPERCGQLRAAISVSDNTDSSDKILLTEETPFELKLTLNDESRWIITYLMMEVALQNQLSIEEFISISQGDLSEFLVPFHNKFMDDDWRLLAELKSVLQPLYTRIIDMQSWSRNGHSGSIWQMLTGLEYLICESDDWAAFVDEHLANLSLVSDQLVMQPHQTTPQMTPQMAAQMAAQMAVQQQAMQQQAGTQRQQTSQPIQMPQGNRAPQPVQSPQPIPNPRPGQNPRSNQNSQPVQNLQPLQRPQPPRLPQLRQRQTSKSPSSSLLDPRFNALSFDSQYFLSASVQAGWERLIGSHTMLRKSPLYTSAIILHPGIRLGFFERVWVGDEVLAWAPEARECLRQLWEASYRRKEPPAQVPSQQPKGSFNDFVFARAEHLDEVDRYLRLDLSNFDQSQDPVEWWLSQRQSFPTLSQLALDIFAIPATSVDFQTASNCAKSYLADRHPDPTTLEYRQCLKDWSRRGVIAIGSVPVGNKVFLKVEPAD